MYNFLTLARIGLFLNATSAIFLVIGSDRILNVVSKFFEITKDTYGTFGQGSTVNEIKKLAVDFMKAKRSAQIINWFGYFLFIIGFLLQMIEV